MPLSRPSELAAAVAARTVDRRERALELLGRLVTLRGGSEDKTAVDRVGTELRAALEPLGFSCEVVTQQRYGDHLVLRNHTRDKALLLAGHMDTTFTDYRGLPSFRLEGERAVGPGTADMRGGLVVLVEALRVLHELGELERLPVTVVLNSDEERGSVTSRELFEQLAAEACQALVFECAGPHGEVVVARRGKLSARVRIEGRAGHAGERGTTKASALVELAHEILAIEALNGRRAGCSANVGRAWGGMASNTFPREAGLELDVRYERPDDRSWIAASLDRITTSCQVDGCRAAWEPTSQRPVWLPSSGPSQAALLTALERAADLARVSLGTELRGGTSDANFFGARGVPTVDGLGPVGFDDHSEREHIVVETLFDRVRLTALALCELSRGGDGGAS